MNKHHPNDHIIEKKLEQLPAVDADRLWNDMHMILDKEMPQKKQRRRFVGWYSGSKGLLLGTIVVLIVTGSLFLVFTKNSSAVTIKELSDSPRTNIVIDDNATEVSPEARENVTTANDPSQKTRSNISPTGPSRSAVGYILNNGLVAQQSLTESEKYAAGDPFSQTTQFAANHEADFHIGTFDLKSVDRDFLASTSSLSQQQQSVANKLKPTVRGDNENGIYGGIISGVDLSSIHFHSVKTGATKGLIVGYAFNQRLSIESGLLLDNKRVYDNGSYFKPPGYTPTTGISIIAVNGKSRIYEWPVNIRYMIIPGRHGLFATAGLSSYFMRSENYDYEYVQNNQPTGHNFLSYKNETKDWFSVANFSLGYSQTLGDFGSIRVEPYLKLPLQNIGVGHMPIMSTGLNIGFTKTLRR